jgi:hypothetical protein
MAASPARYADPDALRDRERSGYDRTAAGMNAISREGFADVRAAPLERAGVDPGQHVLALLRDGMASARCCARCRPGRTCDRSRSVRGDARTRRAKPPRGGARQR